MTGILGETNTIILWCLFIKNGLFRFVGMSHFGFDWQFLFLEGNTVYIDEKVFSITHLPLLLGILQLL